MEQKQFEDSLCDRTIFFIGIAGLILKPKRKTKLGLSAYAIWLIAVLGV
jgi:hypothetical protein